MEKQMYKRLSVLALFPLLILHGIQSSATELGEFCWDFTYFTLQGSWQMQVTQHGSFYELHGMGVSDDGVQASQGTVMGSGYVAGNEARFGIVGLPLNETYGVNDLVLSYGVLVVSLADFSATQYSVVDEPLACWPGTAPCTLSIPLIPVACP
jgi:hypothetical protein